MMGAYYGAVDHLEPIRHGPAFIQGLHDLLLQPRKGPAPELSVNTGPLPELFRQVAPGRVRLRDPENSVQNKALISGLAPVRGAHGQNEALMECPLLVRHQVSCKLVSIADTSLNHDQPDL